MKFFYNNIELDIPDSVYYPREDSLLLAKAIEKFCLKNKKILDMGCGSGFLSVLMAKNNMVTAADINKEAVIATKENAKKNKVEVNAVEKDLFSSMMSPSGRQHINGIEMPLQVKDSFDVIVFNSPYLPVEEGDHDATYSGGRSGRDTIEKFIIGAKNHLNKGGIILLLISSLTGEKEVIGLFEKNGFKAEIIAREKIPWEELMIIEAHIF